MKIIRDAESCPFALFFPLFLEPSMVLALDREIYRESLESKGRARGAK